MAKASPDSEAKIPERDRLVVRDEDCVSGSRLAREQILDCEDVGICYVFYMRKIVEIVAAPDEAPGLPLGDAGMDGRNELLVVWSEDDRRSQRASYEV